MRKLDLTFSRVENIYLTLTINSVDYILRLSYNTRVNAWFFSVYDDEDNILVGSQRLHNLGLYNTANLDENSPEGAFFVDTTVDFEPTYESLGFEHIMYYFDTVEEFKEYINARII